MLSNKWQKQLTESVFQGISIPHYSPNLLNLIHQRSLLVS